MLERSDVSGFVKTIDETAGPSGPVFIITNKQEYRDIKVTKIWDDDDNAQGRRPQEAAVHLLVDGEKVINSESGQEESNCILRIPAGSSPNSAAFSRRPVYERDGETFVLYSVQEDPVEG